MTHFHRILACCLGCTLMFSCGEKAEKPHGDVAKYKTMVVAEQDVTLQREYAARLTGKQIVEVRPQVSGTITRILTGEGESVRRGQVLFVIDQVPYRAALEMAEATRKSAEARLSTARINSENETKLHETGVVSGVSAQTMQNALAEAEATLAQARAQEVNARNNLSYTEVRSPVNGVASMIPWHVGSLVGPSMSEPLVTVADDSDVYAYFSITESQALDLITRFGSLDAFIRESPSVGLLLANGQPYPRQGSISAVSGTVDDQTGAVALRATFPNEGRLLRNGGSATVVVPTHRSGCLVIPQQATFELQNRTFAYRIVNGLTKQTPIEVTRLSDGRSCIAEQGLAKGDTIIAEGAALMKEGIAVNNPSK